MQTMTVAVDLAQPDQRHELVSTVLEKFDAIDILINNAGLETEGAYLSLPSELFNHLPRIRHQGWDVRKVWRYSASFDRILHAHSSCECDRKSHRA